MANKYVRFDASGTGSGDDWTNAYTALPAALVRGNTYYIADGEYSAYTCNDATSGTDLITIKKASQSDHGTETGWDSSYGDGSANFPELTIDTSYWLIDGSYRSSWTGGYGFTITRTAAGKAISINNDSGYITCQYIECIGYGPDDAGAGDDSIYAIGTHTDLSFKYMALHDVGRVQFLLRRQTNLLIEYCYVARNETHPSEHSEAVALFSGGPSENVTIRFNVWVDIEGTGVIVVGGSNVPEPATNVQVYGNLIYWTAAYPNAGQAGGYVSNGTITTQTTEYFSDSFLYNNTVIIPATGGLNFRIGNMVASNGTNNLSKNNLYYCSGSIGLRLSYDDGTIHEYNAYSESGVWSSGETGAQINITDEYFADPANYDFSLVIDTEPGVTLAAPFDTDIVGNPRTSWSRGAYQAQVPLAPSDMGAAANGSSAISLSWTDNSSDETGFKVERSTDGSTWSQIATVGAGVTSYTDTGLAGGTLYYYRVRAYNDNGNSAYSNTANATVLRRLRRVGSRLKLKAFS